MIIFVGVVFSVNQHVSSYFSISNTHQNAIHLWLYGFAAKKREEKQSAWHKSNLRNIHKAGFINKSVAFKTSFHPLTDGPQTNISSGTRAHAQKKYLALMFHHTGVYKYSCQSECVDHQDVWGTGMNEYGIYIQVQNSREGQICTQGNVKTLSMWWL